MSEEYITDFEEMKADRDKWKAKHDELQAANEGLQTQKDELEAALRDANQRVQNAANAFGIEATPHAENELNYTIADLRHQLKKSEKTAKGLAEANVVLVRDLEDARKKHKRAVNYGKEMEEMYASQEATPVSAIEQELRERYEDAHQQARINAYALEHVMGLYDKERAVAADFHVERDEAIKELEEARSLADERWTGYKNAVADRDDARGERKRLRNRIAELEDLVAGHKRAIEEQRALAKERWELWQKAAGELDQIKKAQQAQNPDVVKTEYGNDAY